MGFGDKFNSNDTECANAPATVTDFCYSIPCDHGECTGSYTPWTRNCSCHEGWIGESCDQCCMLSCERGECDIDDRDDKLFCRCPDSYTGPYCQHLLPTTTVATNYSVIKQEVEVAWNPTTISVAVTLVGLVILVFVVSITVFYILYKKRHLLALKLLYRFKKFEDNDGRHFDVFISYRTSDTKNRQFVVKQLLTKIEKWGFKACIDVRDFMIGNDIADNIKMAVMESRRTILVISPAYIMGTWPDFEVQSALLETLRKPHKIIPIIFEPLDDSRAKISNTLQHILDSITYIEWPHMESKTEQKKKEQDFWRKLKLSLPKLKRLKSIKRNDFGSTSNSVTRLEGGFLVEAAPTDKENKLRLDQFFVPSKYTHDNVVNEVIQQTANGI